MSTPDTLVEHLFRREAGRIVASLVRSLGAAHLELAEESVQDAMIKALQLWPFRGIPDNPAAWLSTVARNCALDRIRRDWRLSGQPALDSFAAPDLQTPPIDDQLALILLCCHPALSAETQLVLTLKTVCGFSVREIARALLSQDAAVAQRLVRAKRQIRDQRLQFEVPSGRDLAARLDAVARAIYLLFNEGYSATEGERLLRADLCEEAIRLAMLIADLPAPPRPDLQALVALLCFQFARFQTRVDAEGRLLPLEEQDRQLWDRRLIAAGLRYLDRAASSETLSRYHLEAEIASIYATVHPLDWHRIRNLYDSLYAMDASPVIALNRAVAIARVDGPAAGIAELNTLEQHHALRNYHLLHAVLADLYREIGDLSAASVHYRAALERPCSQPERTFLEARLAEVAG